MNKRILVGWVLALSCVTGFAWADKDKDKDKGKDDHGHAHAAASASGSAPAGSASAGAASKDKDDDDGDSPADEKPDNKEKRRSYIRSMKTKLGNAAHADGKKMTAEERELMQAHWRRTMRLWRIRHLAEADGDKALVAKVDALLAKVDKTTLDKMKELNAKAPKGDATPAASASAAKGGAK